MFRITAVNINLSNCAYTHTTLGTGIDKYVFPSLKLVIVNFNNATIPSTGISVGESIASTPFMFGIGIINNVIGYIRNYKTTDYLIWKNGESVTNVYGTWIGIIT